MKFLMAFMLAFLVPVLAHADPVMDRINKSGEIRCGYIIYPPLFDKDLKTGKFSGSSYDLMEEMGKQLGFKIVWAEEVGADNALSGLETGRYDAFCIGMWINPSRAKAALFADPFYYEGIYAFARKNEKRFAAGPKSLNRPDIKIVVQEGETSQVLAKEDFPAASVVTQPGTSGPSVRFLDVASNKADATFNEMTVFNQYDQANPDKIKLLYSDPLRLNAAAFSVPKGEHDLLALLNSTIQTMQNLGIVNRILDKYDPDRKIYLRVAKPYMVTK